jgi:hypothetical protein
VLKSGSLLRGSEPGTPEPQSVINYGSVHLDPPGDDRLHILVRVIYEKNASSNDGPGDVERSPAVGR